MARNTGPNTLNNQQLLFVTEYLKNGRNARQAAISAGYSPKNAHNQGSELLKNSKIKSFLAATSEAAAKEHGVFNISQAMKEADEAIAFAILTNNANARVKALELKMKLHGLLVEKHDVRNTGAFSFQILPMNAAPLASPPVDVTPEIAPPSVELLPLSEKKETDA